MKNLMITGGAGFIGANFVLHMMEKYPDYKIVVYDKLTYAGNLDNLREVSHLQNYTFVQGDICDADKVAETIQAHNIDTLVNFAAETHVDRSILDPDAFVRTSVNGTWVLLEAAKSLQLERYHQISTDEVYGDIPEGKSSVEGDPLEPRSPYAASKASADLMVQAYHTTFGLPTTITRGSNNIGPYQYPEKVIPLFTTNAMDGKQLPVYGDGKQKREYQFVMDHCEAIDAVLHKGNIGEIYNVGTGVEVENMRMVEILIETLGCSPDLIQHVKDRPGHDRRYSLNIDKIKSLGWKPRHDPEYAIKRTVEWYRDNEWWWRKVRNEDFDKYYKTQYGDRLKI